MRITLILLLAGLFTTTGAAQDKVTEPSTGHPFPATVTVSVAGKPVILRCTGVAVRKKFIIKVYGMAHYMQDPVKGSEEDVLASILTDGKAKQITLHFVRNVDASSIQGAYRDGFKNAATAADQEKIKASVEKFLGYFSSDVKEGDSFTYQWLPGGIVAVSARGDEKPAITDPVFARALWAIWFGEDSIVDREDLVQSLLTK
jgi:hypothetical protein